MKLKLPPNLYAPEQITAVRYELQSYGEWMSNNQVRARTGAQAVEEPALSDDTIALLKNWQDGDPVTARSVSELANYLAKLSLPVIHIMMATMPNASFKKELVAWFRQLGGCDYLISISVNRTIGGGAIVRTPNHYYDFSYGHLVTQNRDKLPQIIRQMAAAEAVASAPEASNMPTGLSSV